MIKKMPSNNSNNSKNEIADPNDYVEFMPYWKSEEQCYKEAIIDVITTYANGAEKKEKKAWPRAKPTEQIGYERFMAKITNPVTKKFYSERDRNGNEIKQPDGRNARYVISYITRIKRRDGSEYLYTSGNINGFDSLGVPVTHHISNPERWLKTDFSYERKYDDKSKAVIEYTTGVGNTYDVYEMPFSKENVDRLYKQSVGTSEQNILINNPHIQQVVFYVKDEQTDLTIKTYWSSIEKTLELFKTKDFEYLFNGDYVPDDVKREMRAKSIGLTNNQPVEIPRLEKDNKNYKDFVK